MADEVSVWSPPAGEATVNVDADLKIITERQVAIEGQSIFTLTTFTYVPTSGAMKVFKNGLYLDIGVDFVEISEDKVGLVVPATAGDVLIFVGMIGFSSLTAEAFAGFAQEWAVTDEDVLVSAAAGGNQIDEYSALHYALKAAASAAAAAASYDSFDDRYLGAKAADPATDNDGDPLLEGAIYWNTAIKRLKFWNGIAWILEDFVPSTGVTASALIPSGTTAQRDGVPSVGMFRHNTTTNEYEAYYGAPISDWRAVGGGQMLGNAAVKAIHYNAQTIAEDITVPTTVNALSAGPIIVADGFTVTVSDGAVWVVI